MLVTQQGVTTRRTITYTLTFNIDDNYDLNDVLESIVENNDGQVFYMLAEAITCGDVEITIADGKATTHCGAFNDEDDAVFAQDIADALTASNV